MRAEHQIDADIRWHNTVLALPDHQLNLALAVLSGHNATLQDYQVVIPKSKKCYENIVFNPLTNPSQFLALFKQFDVERTYEPYDFIGWGYRVHDFKGSPIITTEGQDFNGSGKPELSMEKAACVAIVFEHYNPARLEKLLDDYG